MFHFIGKVGTNLYKQYGADYILSHVSNNHIITLSSGLKKQLMRIKQSQVVRIIGYLVQVATSDGVTWGPSSMSRTDTGNGACEIILADDIVIMK